MALAWTLLVMEERWQDGYSCEHSTALSPGVGHCFSILLSVQVTVHKSANNILFPNEAALYVYNFELTYYTQITLSLTLLERYMYII